MKSIQGGKLSNCDNVKIDWGLEQVSRRFNLFTLSHKAVLLNDLFHLKAENIYEDPCNFGDLRIDLQSEDEGIEEPVKTRALEVVCSRILLKYVETFST